MNKLVIPAILAATVLVAGMFAFVPVDRASTVHTTINAATVGLACLTDTFTITAGIDGDAITLTFTPAMQILGLRVNTDNAGATLGFDADPTVNGAVIQTTLVAETIDDTPQVEIISEMAASAPLTVDATGALVLTVDDDAGGALVATDIITFEICGLVTDPANFVDASVAITGPNGAE